MSNPGDAQAQWDPNTQTVPPTPRNGMGTAALVVGVLALLSLTICWVPFLGLITVVLGLVAAILGFLGRGRVKKMQATNGGAALTGIVLGIVSFLIGAVVQAFVIVGTVLFLNAGGGQSLEQLQQCAAQAQSAGDPAAVQQALQQCQEQFSQQLPQFGG